MRKSFIDQITERKQLEAEAEARGAASLAGLCQTEGYRYLQIMAARIEAKYACKPTDPGWHVYSTIGYAFGSLFAEVTAKTKEIQQQAVGPTSGKSILAEIQEKHGNRNTRQPNHDPASYYPSSGRR